MLESTEKHSISELPKGSVQVKGYQFLSTRTERIVFLILLTLGAVAPIMFGKSIPSHADWHIHIEHAYNFKRCFWQGQWLPRWIDAHANGYGEPIFNYYAPLVYYLFVLLELIFRNPILSIKWAFIIPMILCTVTGYIYLRRHGSPVSSTIAMAFVIFSPAIHIFVYNTNWPTSTLAIAFLFSTLYGIDSFNNKEQFDIKSLLITSISFALMAIVHLATAYIFILIAIPYFFMNLYIHRSRRFVKNYVLSLVLGAALAGFYLFPACLEKNIVHTDEILTQAPLWDYSKNFLFTYLDRHRDDGYAWAIFDHRYYEVSNALFSLAVGFCLMILLLNMNKVKEYFNEPFRVIMAISLFIFCFLMMTPVSIFIWLVLKPMQTIQFPWRFTLLILPFGATIMVYAFDLISKLVKEEIYLKGYKVVFYAMFFVFCLLVYVDVVNMYKWKWVPEQSLLKAGLNVLWGNEEYRPSLTGDPNWKAIDYRRDFTPAIDSTSKFVDINLLKWTSHNRLFEVLSAEEHQLRIRTFFFPGWNVYIDERKTDISMDPKTGCMLIRVPSGKHKIRVSFELTPLRRTSAYISLAGLVLYFYFLFQFIRGKKITFVNIAKLKEIENKKFEEAQNV